MEHLTFTIRDFFRQSLPKTHLLFYILIFLCFQVYFWLVMSLLIYMQHQFQTRSDSEAALLLYGEQGTACVLDLDGMFAFAVADGNDLFVVRDPIGIKPLYIGWRNGNFLLSSEIKALIGFADNISKFPPGSWFHSRMGMRTYYEVPDKAPERRTFTEHITLLRETLERSVVKRLMSDVPIGASLSGGLDSSIIAAIIRPHVEKLHTFSVGIEGSRDLDAARIVARHLDTIHHEYVLEPTEIAGCLQKILYPLESFDQDLVRSAIPCYFTARLAVLEVKVILTGEGADELFAGYQYYRDYKDFAYLHRELRRSVMSLHNINLQRV
mmetsp:Transcript_7436/g.4017  ORF Transcript_7436/g.4017 Transcript_7436/m.4017 type:complete len:325 (-) Transcript_7436:1034-2008(-)